MFLHPFVHCSVQAQREAGENEEKLLWNLMSKNRKHQEPESPMGPKEIIRQADTKQKKPLVHSRRATRNQTRLSSSNGGSQCFDSTWRVTYGQNSNLEVSKVCTSLHKNISLLCSEKTISLKTDCVLFYHVITCTWVSSIETCPNI